MGERDGTGDLVEKGRIGGCLGGRKTEDKDYLSSSRRKGSPGINMTTGKF